MSVFQTNELIMALQQAKTNDAKVQALLDALHAISGDLEQDAASSVQNAQYLKAKLAQYAHLVDEVIKQIE